MKKLTKEDIVKELLRRFLLPMPDAYQCVESVWLDQQFIPYFESIQDKKLLSDALIELYMKHGYDIGVGFVQHYVETYAIKEDYFKILKEQYETLKSGRDTLEKSLLEMDLIRYGLLKSKPVTKKSEFLKLARKIKQYLELTSHNTENNYIYQELERLTKIVEENKYQNKPRKTDIDIVAIKTFSVTEETLIQEFRELAEKYRKLPDFSK